MRAFIAIKLAPQIKEKLGVIQKRLIPCLPKLDWVKPDNLHLSLKFLGEISLPQAQDLEQMIAQIVKTASPFQITLKTLGVFPDYRRARIIWIGTDQAPPELKQLTIQLENKCLKLGIPQEVHPFQAHITLGRIKTKINPAVLEETLKGLTNEITGMDLRLDFKGITLFQSVLAPGGATYSILKEELLPASV